MNQQALYEEISRRKSVRKYKAQYLEESVLERIRTLISGLHPLQQSIPVEIGLCKPGEIGSAFRVAAPHYLVCLAPPDAAGRMEAGFRMEQLALALSAEEIGCCYLGMAKPKKDLRAKDGMEWAVSMAFGAADGPLRRESPNKFTRKPADEVAATTLPEPWREAVRLAPSAVNGQPWYFSGDNSRVFVWKRRAGGIKGMMTGSLSDVDMGIALCHLYLAVAKDNRSLRLEQEAGIQPPEKGLEYAGTVLTEEKD